MMTAILAFAVMQNPCPFTIGVGKDGAIFTNRFYGWYKTNPKTLQNVLHAGCYNDNVPQLITSVKLEFAANAPKARIDLVYSILGREGWAPERVTVRPWVQYPAKPQ
jgi:hypothetical protein